MVKLIHMCSIHIFFFSPLISSLEVFYIQRFCSRVPEIQKGKVTSEESLEAVYSSYKMVGLSLSRSLFFSSWVIPSNLFERLGYTDFLKNTEKNKKLRLLPLTSQISWTNHMLKICSCIYWFCKRRHRLNTVFVIKSKSFVLKRGSLQKNVFGLL